MASRGMSGIFTCMKCVLLVAQLTCLTLGCSGDPEPEPSVWVGELRGTDVKVALADKGDGAMVLFFCGGDESYATGTHWSSEGVLRTKPFSSSEGDWTVEGAIKGNVASGKASSDLLPSRSWTATSGDSSTIAGLYEGSAPCGKLGLIVTQRTVGDAPSGQGACLRVEGGRPVVEQVNPIRLAQNNLREISVSVASAPEQEFTVRPVARVAR